MDVKWCSIGQHEEQVTLFGISRKRYDGLQSSCKKCLREYKKKKRSDNPDEAKKQYKKWNDSRRSSPEKIETAKSKRRSSYSPDKNKQYCLNRRARQAKVPNNMPKDWWQILLNIYGPWCMYPGCDKEICESNPLTHDHVIPLSWPGSSHSIENSQLLCYSHNSSKGGRSCDDYRVVK